MVAAQGRETKAQQKSSEDTQITETQADMATLLQKIEAFLKEKETPPVPHLTEDIRVALSAPLDPKFLRSRKGSGGKTFSYADLDYLESRVAAVDPDWAIHFTSTTQNVIVCTVVIHTIPRSAVAGYYIPDEYEIWDNNKKQMVSRLMTAETSHTVVTRAQAAAERRAFAMFGLGAELWAKNQEDASDFIPGNEGGGKPQSRTSGGGSEFRAPSEKRVDLLISMGVSAEVASAINSWSRGKDSAGNPISDVSQVISALFKARGSDKGPVSRKTWELIVSEHAPYALASTTEDSDDEDWDQD